MSPESSLRSVPQEKQQQQQRQFDDLSKLERGVMTLGQTDEKDDTKVAVSNTTAVTPSASTGTEIEIGG